MFHNKHIHFDEEELEITYKKFNGSDRTSHCSAEIVFSSMDRVILDERNIERLNRKLSKLLSAMVYSRSLMRGGRSP